MVKAFFRHCLMPGALHVPMNLLLLEQVEETVLQAIPVVTTVTPDYDSKKEELDCLLSMEPQRCYERMRPMFMANPEDEMTQVDFWNLHNSHYVSSASPFSLLPASSGT
ncbi:hypothetical protein EDD16DRAFT_92128 [Pisolithus croceorrhizus]|nr:hypothetical protein EDD16DRAFT_92128 [Pisolithus croceorrhizus]